LALKNRFISAPAFSHVPLQFRSRTSRDRFREKTQSLCARHRSDEALLKEIIHDWHVSDLARQQNGQHIGQFLVWREADREWTHDVIGDDAVQLLACVEVFLEVL